VSDATQAHDQLPRLVELRRRLQEERTEASTPAVARALETADYYLLIALGYLGHDDYLFPEQERAFVPDEAL
jgi:hypothetical protein